MARTLTKRPEHPGKRSSGNQTDQILQDMLKRQPQDSEDPRSVSRRSIQPLPRMRGGYVGSKRSKYNPPV
jgi:hypothetical protein